MSNHTGLRLAKRPRKAWVAGSGRASVRFGGDLNPTGDWTSSVPPFEAQSSDRFDPQSCALEHTIRAWITLARYQGFSDFLPDGSERYLGSFAGTDARGTDPYLVADVARRICGLIPQSLMPFAGETTFDTFYNKKVAKENIRTGLALLELFELGHQDLWEYGADLTAKEKANLIETYLRRGTVCVSISGRYRTKNGRLYKEKGERDTHWVLLTKKDTISDSYLPEIKKLAKEYDHEMATVYFLKRKDPKTLTFWTNIWKSFSLLWKQY